MTDSETGAITIYTDGACSGNPGPGGWGAVMLAGEHKRELKGGEAGTTNNRMELMGAIMALEALKRRSSVDLYTDSTYVRQGISQWIHNWKRNGWKTADKKDVKNADLWQRLDKARLAHDIRWHWVKGHAGHPLNERADELARQGLKQARDGEPVSDTVIEASAPHPTPLPMGERGKSATPSRSAPGGAATASLPLSPPGRGQGEGKKNGEGKTGETALPPLGLTPAFTLDPRLATDTIEVGALPLCRVLLMNERRYPWLILVPLRDGLIEIADLSETDSQQLMREIRQAAHLLGALFAFDKINVGALGNVVSQLHVHVIARKRVDPAWPGPVWGHSPVERYPEPALLALRERIAAALASA